MSPNPKNTPKNNSSLSDKFHNYIVSKVIDWAISDQANKGRFSAFKWGPEDQKLLSQIIENPKNAGLNLPIQDSKFKRFFQSIAENGLNTLDVKMFYRYRDRLPLRQLQWEFKKEDFTFIKQKLISKEEIPAGYYMLEVGINTTSFRSQLSFDLNTDGTKKIQIFELKARSHRICKRLIYLENSSKLATNLSEQIQPNNIYHLRLARLTKNFFLSRMFNKIGRQFNVKTHDELNQDEFEVLWGRYDSLFQKNKNPFTEYAYYIKQIENKQIPSRAEQLRNLQLWKMKNR
jgi:hypothetical protein